MEKIHVSVRSRPLPTEDAKKSPWKISSDSIFMRNHSFPFDRIFREDCKTVQVYEARTKDIVAAAVRGFNGTVFAYGQTNSGKTHTMRGSPTEPGVIPLAVHDLFETIYQDASREFLVRMSYLEIYNEEINDLLAPEQRKLQIHENLEKGIFVAGLREKIVTSPQKVLEMMEFGESHRHTGKTNMNVHSSRSHTIFRLTIESSQKTQDEGVGNACHAVRFSVLNLVDLAGSERASKTGAEGSRLKEGSHINKSLMSLGTVIEKLSENQGGHVPYRDSKLTRILQPALGGNANTAIICNITLAPIHADETKSTLQFASRARRVTNCAHVNEISTDAALLKRQKKEIEELRSKLKTSQSDHSDEDILNLRNTLLKSELERERIAMELDEEKKAQAQREKVLQEQAKKIENLSSMVRFSNRDEKRERETGTLLPFAECSSISEQDENSIDEDLLLKYETEVILCPSHREWEKLDLLSHMEYLEKDIASAERRLKHLRRQKALLERYISNQKSFAVKTQDERDANQVTDLEEEDKGIEVEVEASAEDANDTEISSTVEPEEEDLRAATMDFPVFNKRKKLPWTQEEVQMLMRGVKEFTSAGYKNMPWKLILRMGKGVFQPSRSSENLRDKFKNMSKAGRLPLLTD